MKLHYIKILLFSILLNILLKESSNAYSKNEPYIMPYTRTTTPRILIECDIYTSFYDNDPEMKSVKQNFNRQTSQRFEEYNERMINKRQKCKEQCYKDIQKIIVKDKVEKSLAQKVEKGCLMCGYGLGCVATSVGVLGTAVVNELRRVAMAAAIESAIAGGEAKGVAEGAAAGATKLIELIKSKLGVHNIVKDALESVITAQNYTNVSDISGSIYMQYYMTCIQTSNSLYDTGNSMCTSVYTFGNGLGENVLTHDSIKISLQNFLSEAEGAAAAENTKVATAQISALKKTYMDAVQAEFNGYIYSINASVIAILIIVLVMVIIYLILRYRRKRKMNKKLQYIKLLKE
ncbi:PIR protein, putative [Plasmodium sp. gorilla clade G1]|nr:PIR protein, putative [Plasmodium sp. gorilla clade G1]